MQSVVVSTVEPASEKYSRHVQVVLDKLLLHDFINSALQVSFIWYKLLPICFLEVIDQSEDKSSNMLELCLLFDILFAVA